MANAAHNSRPNRESVSKRIGAKATAWIWRRDNHRCVYCGCRLAKGGGAHLDHLQPQAHGGQDLVTNLVLACERCNSARQDLSLRQWAAYAAEVYGLRVRPAAVLARAATPVPRAYAGRGRAWAGAAIV
jgi:endonuclease I